MSDSCHFVLVMIERRNMDLQIKRPLLSNDTNEDEDTKNPTKRKLYNYWQRRKEAWKRLRYLREICQKSGQKSQQ